MTVKIIFEAHSTTWDNEAEKSSGWNDVRLSLPLGYKQSEELGERFVGKHLDAIFCSDLQRAYLSAEIGFAGRDIPIFRDARLRECNYGDLTQGPADAVNGQKAERIDVPFPNGESYTDTNKRMKEFLDELKTNYDGKTVLVVGHRATQYALDHFILGQPMKEIVAKKFKWQPGWEYEL
ncbi:MAG: histidine phosphatase family protein [Alphaproteobacteria bacterium]|nr:histidine phosphatase family protein [Alphaproteobacteria bacterium]MCL2757847.1 histidine phosphatase family protein [Alphaproteobacteria bacterium]